MSNYMPEAEVIIRTALYFIRNHITEGPVKISIDGAHIKTGDTVHFKIKDFLKENGCVKTDGNEVRWQGTYKINEYNPSLEIVSRSGEGDVVIPLASGKRLLIEAKKGGGDMKGNQEYPLMREAIGQVLTNGNYDQNTILGVAVPCTEKSRELADRWSKYELIRRCEITFLLVESDGNVVIIGG